MSPRAQHELPDVEGLLAGTATVDLTPPPGMPKAGYSANACDGTGFRTRLRAAVLHLRSGGTSIALVQCDLLGGSSVVHHLVAHAIADRTDIPLAGLFVGATHTHAGPGQYLGTDFYNRFASNRSGFDPGYTQFLVDQIAAAVIDAFASRRKAVLAVGSRHVWGLTRNRSLDAHVRNRTVSDTRTSPERKFLAVNPRLHMIRVDTIDGRGTTTPLSANVIFSVHGTGIPMEADEYNADLWAYLKGELALQVEHATGTRPAVGAMEGNHADVAPALRPGTAGHLEAGHLGRAIGTEAASLHASLGDRLTGEVRLGAAFRELDLDDPSARSIQGITIPRRPAVGAALLGGAHENLTPVVHRIPPFGPGMPKPFGRAAVHGRKWVIGSRWLQPIVLPLRGFPSVVPIQVLRIGATAIVGVPFEVTVEAGRRIEAAVLGEVTPIGVDAVAVSSVANDYCGYTATAEEYDRQHYEGAHTLFGPRFERYLTAQAARLAADLGKDPYLLDAMPSRRWDLKVVHHLARAVGQGRAGESEGARSVRRITRQPRYIDATATTDGCWELTWVDVAPGELAWDRPMVRVEVHTGAAWVPARSRDGHEADDQGWQLQVRHELRSRPRDRRSRPRDRRSGPRDRPSRHDYIVRWWDPFTEGGRLYRFVLAPNAAQPEVASTPFP